MCSATPMSDGARVEQMRQLANVAQGKVDEGRVVVIAGDMNARRQCVAAAIGAARFRRGTSLCTAAL